MIERRPFTPEDYRIGNEKAKGTSDYPTQGTPPRDRLLNPHTGKRRISVHGSVETHSPIQTPEDALIEAEERHLRGEKQKAIKEGRNEDFEVGIEKVHDFDETVEPHDLTLPSKLREKRVGTDWLRKETTPRKYRGTQKPKYKEHGRQSRAS